MAVPQFTPEAYQALRSAAQEAERWGDSCVTPDHLLLGLLRSPGTGAGRLLVQFRLDLQPLIARLERYLSWADHGSHLEIRKAHARKADDPHLNQFLPRLGVVLDLAAAEARHHGRPAVGTEHLLLGIVSEAGSLGAWLLLQAGLHAETLRAAVAARLPEDVAARGVWLAVTRSQERALRAVKGLGLLAFCWLTLALALFAGVIEKVLDPRLWPSFVRFVWFTGATLGLLRAGLRLERSVWPGMQALLFVASAGAAGLLVSALTGPVDSLRRDVGPLAFYCMATSSMAWMLFRERGGFGVGQREGWRVLWQEGRWYLLISSVLELAALWGVMLRG